MLSNIESGASMAVSAPAQIVTKHQDHAEGNIQLFGWDSRGRNWHGPSEILLAGSVPHRLAEALGRSPGPSWFGPLTCSVRGELASRFFLVTHDLSDCGVAMIYCAESKAGPLEIVAVVPAERRPRLRPEFAFEFLAFSGFLGSLKGDAEFKVSEGIQAALGETAVTDSLVISLSTGMWAEDLDDVLSRCVEQTAGAVLLWLRAHPGDAPALSPALVPHPAKCNIERKSYPSET